MDEKQLQVLVTELAKNLKIPEDLSQLSRFLKKLTVEAALKAELTTHLGHEKHQLKSGSNILMLKFSYVSAIICAMCPGKTRKPWLKT
ncbi:hypothetical protein [Xenorhabdus griffiniae]|uniref:hypothetical protein n=1 Tax=Xenorhabdus griffiniae TaxID=351672 RepID=UPI0037DCEE34